METGVSKKEFLHVGASGTTAQGCEGVLAQGMCHHAMQPLVVTVLSVHSASGRFCFYV